MIDTISLYKQIELSNNEITRIGKHLTELKLIHDVESGNIKLKGKMKNLMIEVCSNRMNISRSLNKFNKGCNVKPINLYELYDSVEQISSVLEIDIQELLVGRLDLAINILSDVNIAIIKNTLTPPSYLKMKALDNGVSYINKSRILCFYEKFKLSQEQGIHIPNIFKTREFIRVEYRFLKAETLANILMKEKVTLFDVLNNYSKLTLMFKEYLMNLQWAQTKINDASSLQELGIGKFLETKGLQYVGMEEMYNLIDLVKANDKTSYKNKFVNYKKRLQNLNGYSITNTIEQQITTFKKMIELAFAYDDFLSISSVSK